MVLRRKERRAKGIAARDIAVMSVLFLAFADTAVATLKWPSIGTFAMPDGGTATIFIDTGNGMTRHTDFWTAKQKTLLTAPQKTASGASFLSELDEYAYDCKGNRAALISYSRYEGKDLSGAIVERREPLSSPNYEWMTPNEGTILAKASKLVCGLGAMRTR